MKRKKRKIKKSKSKSKSKRKKIVVKKNKQKRKKIIFKKSLSKKQIAKKLKNAKRVTKSIDELKKTNDKKFVARAENESLIPSTNLNAEIRERATRKRATKNQIIAQKNKIDELTRQNKKIKQRREDLELEYPFTDDERKREIERLLKSPDYQLRDLFTQKNILKQMRGENFDFIVDDGFEKYKINSREFKKQWKIGGDASLPILKRMRRNALKSIKYYKQLIEKSKKSASRVELKKLNRILNGLQNKLLFTIEKNIDALKTGDMSNLDEYNDNGEKAYSILNRVIGFSIDRIGI